MTERRPSLRRGSPQEGAAQTATATKKRESFFKSRGWRVFRRNRLALFGAVVLLLFVLVAIFAPLLTPYPPDKVNLDKSFNPPSRAHLLGTDRIGRDFLSRLMFGSRVSLLVGFGGAALAGVIGIVLGSISGFRGGFLDKALLKVSEVVICFPSLVLVLMLVAVVGRSLLNIILIFGFTQWISMYRLIRTLFISLREEEFVEALKAFGVSRVSIMFRHMLPNAIAPVTVWITLTMAGMILQEAGLSFLGLGVPTSMPSWGNLLFAAQDLSILQHRPWLWVPPGVVVSLTVLSINFLGDGLRDALNPRK